MGIQGNPSLSGPYHIHPTKGFIGEEEPIDGELKIVWRDDHGVTRGGSTLMELVDLCYEAGLDKNEKTKPLLYELASLTEQVEALRGDTVYRRERRK